MKFHPSSLGLIMTDAQSVDRNLVPADLLPVLDKARKTDADRELLLPFKEASLSAGAKTFLNSIAKEEVYKYRLQVETKYMDKGLACEDEAIEMLNFLRFKSYVKNTERRESEFLTGECDIIIPRIKTIDTKVAWSLATFPAVSEDAHDPLYEWQGRAYMKLWDVPEHEVCWLMLNTPEDLIRWEQRSLHIVDHIPPELRLTSISYQRDLVLEAKMDRKCASAMAYLKRRIDLITSERVPAPKFKPTVLPVTTIEENMITETPAAQADLIEPAEELALAKASTEGAELSPAAQALLEQEGAANFERAHTPPTLRLGQIGERLGFTVTADFMLSLGFAPTATDKAAKLYHEADFKNICAALIRHISAVSAK